MLDDESAFYSPPLRVTHAEEAEGGDYEGGEGVPELGDVDGPDVVVLAPVDGGGDWIPVAWAAMCDMAECLRFHG